MHLPSNTFSARHESRGTDSNGGTALTANVTANVKGTWTALGAATSFAYEGITIYAGFSDARDFMVDIGIDDGGGNNHILIPDLHLAFFKQVNEHNFQLSVPVHVPAGALVEARVAASTGSSVTDLHIVGHSANPGGFPGYSRAVALFTPASSRGVAVDPGATANTKGAWAQLTASTPADIAAIFGVVGFNNDVARTAVGSMLLDIGIGAAAAEFVLLEGIQFGWGSTWDGPNDIFFPPVAAAISSGARIAARAQCSDNIAGDRSVDLALYGLVR